MDPLLGRVIAGKYKLSRCVGRGGMGAVYESRHQYTDQRVAVKVLAPHLSRDLKLVARFRREAMATSRLKHENCVGVHDFGEDEGGTFFIAMEFVDGHGIGDELRASGPMPVSRAVRIGVQLLSALEAAHEGGILHRDLKPQNIMLTQKVGRPDFVKVVDFGIAKFIENSAEDQAALTLPGTIFGTPEYMSPEQARGEVLDARSDLYSAAVVLWHMLLGRSPFRGKTVRETLMKVFREDPPSPAAERPADDIPKELEASLRRALEKEADRRYQTATEFKAALEPYADRLLSLSKGGGPLPGRAADGSAPETVGMGHGGGGPAGTQVSPRVDSTELDGAPEPFVEKTAESPQPKGPTKTAAVVPPPASGSATAALASLPAETEEQPPVDPHAATRVPASHADTRTLAPAEGGASDPVLRVVDPVMRPQPKLGLAAWLAIFILGGGAIGVGLAVLAVKLRQPVVVAKQPTDPKDPKQPTEPKDPKQPTDAKDPKQPADAKDPDAERAHALTALLETADRAVARNDDQVAVRALTQAIELDPDNVQAHRTLGMVAWRAKDYSKAKKHLSEAARLDERYQKQLAPILLILDKKMAQGGG